MISCVHYFLYPRNEIIIAKMNYLNSLVRVAYKNDMGRVPCFGNGV